jgi:hypothetical protein
MHVDGSASFAVLGSGPSSTIHVTGSASFAVLGSGPSSTIDVAGSASFAVLGSEPSSTVREADPAGRRNDVMSANLGDSGMAAGIGTMGVPPIALL